MKTYMKEFREKAVAGCRASALTATAAGPSARRRISLIIDWVFRIAEANCRFGTLAASFVAWESFMLTFWLVINAESENESKP